MSRRDHDHRRRGDEVFAERAFAEGRARAPRVFRIFGEIQRDVVVVCSGDHGFDVRLLFNVGLQLRARRGSGETLG